MSILPEIFESSIDLPNGKGSGDTLLPLWLIDHPTLSLNTFCATGIGGGIDATCSPGEGSGKGGIDGKGEGTDRGESKKSNKGEKILSVSGIVTRLKALGATVGHIEHSVKEWVSDKCERSVLKLPLPLRDVVEGIFHVTRVGTKAAFVTWTAGQALAEQVSKERGNSPEEARRLRGVLSTIDLAATKPVIIASEMAHMAAPLLFTVGMIPPATAGYLAYSTAKNPLATVRAVRNLIKGKLTERSEKAQRIGEGGHATVRLGLEQITHNVDDDNTDKQLDTVRRIESTLRAHDYSDWYISLLSVALDETQSIDEALSLSDELYREHPTDPHNPTDNTESTYTFPQENGPGKGTLTGNTRWVYKDDASKIEAFQEWLRDQFDTELTSLTDEELWQRYIASGFKKGAGQAYDNVKRKIKSSGIGPKGKARKEPGVSDTPSSTLDFYSMSKDDFLEDSFANPTSIEKVKLLAGRAFDELEGITDDMSLKMSRVLADGLTQGKSPIDIARDMADEVDISRDRAFKISQTELIRAHAEGSLTALEDLGVEEVGVAVEWSTAGDNRVCPECGALQGIVLTIDEARGQIPVHPLCRCTWVPANVGEEQTEQGNRQKRTAKAIKAAIGEAEEESGEDMDIEIGMDRPKGILGNSVGNVTNVTEEYTSGSNYPGLNYPPSLLDFSRWAGQYGYEVSNAFCATGKGGGVDPSCGNGGKGAGKGKKPDTQDVYERTYTALSQGIQGEHRSKLLDDITKLSKKDAQSLHTRLGLKGSSKDAAELRRNLVNELVRKNSGTPVTPQTSTSAPKIATKDTTVTISSPEDKGGYKRVTDEHVNHLVEGVTIHGGKHNLADIVDVRRHLEGKGITTREHQDAVIQEATKRGLVYGSGYEGRHGITPAQQQAQIRHEGAVGTGLLSIKSGVTPTGNVFCPTGKGGGVDPSCGSSANRPSLPSERHEGASPTPVEWVPPPPKKGKKGGGQITRPKGDEAQGVIGDLGEEKAIALGFRNILPEGKRSFTAKEVEEKGSSIDLEFDHSGKLYEVKLCNDTSTEYRLKAKKEEKDAKVKYANSVKAEVYTMVAVRDTDKGEIHYYAAKKPGLTGAEVSDKNFDYLGKVKI